MDDTGSVLTADSTNLSTDSGTEIVNKSFQKTSVDDLLDSYDEVAKEEAKQTNTKGGDNNGRKEESKSASEKVATSKQKEEVTLPAKEASPEGEESTEPQPPIEKAFKAKLGEEEYEVPEDLSFEVELANGKKTTVTQKEAIEAFKGREQFNRDMDRRVQAIVSRENKIQKDLQESKTAIKQLVEETKKGDFLKMLNTMAEISGVDPVDFEMDFIKQMRVIGPKINQVSEEELNRLYLERKNKHLESRLESKVTEEQRSIQMQQMQQEVEKTSEELGVPVDAIAKAYQELIEFKVFDNPDEIQLSDVKQYIGEIRTLDRVDAILKEVAPDRVSDDKLKNAVLQTIKSDSSITNEDVKEILQSVILKAQPVANLNRKVEKSGGLSRFKPQSTVTGNEPSDELVDELYTRHDRYPSNKTGLRYR